MIIHFRFGSHRTETTETRPREPWSGSRSRFNNHDKKVFVGGVSQETTLEEVRSYFSRFGKIDAAVLVPTQEAKKRRILGGTDWRDRRAWEHKGFGFITFASDVVAEKVSFQKQKAVEKVINNDNLMLIGYS